MEILLTFPLKPYEAVISLIASAHILPRRYFTINRFSYDSVSKMDNGSWSEEK